MKKRFSQIPHLSSIECPKSNFDFRYLFVLTNRMYPLIENSNFVIRWQFKSIYQLSSLHFLSSLIQKLPQGFFRFTPVLAHLESSNKMEVKDAMIFYAPVKSRINVKCENKITQEKPKVPNTGSQKKCVPSLSPYFLSCQ